MIDNLDTLTDDEETATLEPLPEVVLPEVVYDTRFLTRVIEAALLASAEPLTLDRMLQLFDEDRQPSKTQLQESLAQLRQGRPDSAIQLQEVASGWRFVVCDDLAPWVNRLFDEKPARYSRALLETLALIAYRQPITRGDIEAVRGVSVSSQIIKNLTDRNWIKVVGHKDLPGRPALFATTKDFLDYFGLKSLSELPALQELPMVAATSPHGTRVAELADALAPVPVVASHSHNDSLSGPDTEPNPVFTALSHAETPPVETLNE
jgi:segregation and condensation protein B